MNWKTIKIAYDYEELKIKKNMFKYYLNYLKYSIIVSDFKKVRIEWLIKILLELYK